MIAVSEVNALDGVRPLWDAMVAANGPWDAQMSVDWLDLWWRCYKEGRELIVLVAEERGEVVGLVALMIARSKVDGARELTFLGQDPLDYSDFALRGDRRAILEAMLRHLRGRRAWDRFELIELREDSPNLEPLKEALGALGAGMDQEVCTICPYVDLRAGRAVHAAAMGRKLRTDVRRRRGLLEKLGPVALERHRRCGEELLEQLLLINRAHYALKGFQDLAKSEIKKIYVRGFLQLLAERGQLDVAVLRAGDRPIAYNIGYVHDGVLNYWRTGFDPEYARFSPGKLLVHQLIEDAFAEGHREFNFLRGDEPYKLEWTRLARSNYRVLIRGL